MKKSVEPPKLIPIQQAIYMVNDKINKLEIKLSGTVSLLETKLGKHETFVTDNMPDIDLFNTAFSDINKRLLDLESLNKRIAHLEETLNVKPPVTSGSSKKKSTIKLNELKDVSEPGISFS
jgi:hypothetical protein